MHRIASFKQRLHHALQRLTPKDHPASTGGYITSSTALDVLADKRRRTAIEHLATLGDRDAPVPVSELATNVAAVEYDCGLSEITTEQQNRVRIALYQSHLPTMADAGVIDYDTDQGVVTPTSGNTVLYRAYNAFSRELCR